MLYETKERPNDAAYLNVLRHMTPQQRLAKAFELSELTRKLFRQGLSERFPDLAADDFHKLYLERLARCHNRNY